MALKLADYYSELNTIATQLYDVYRDNNYSQQLANYFKVTILELYREYIPAIYYGDINDIKYLKYMHGKTSPFHTYIVFLFRPKSKAEFENINKFMSWVRELYSEIGYRLMGNRYGENFKNLMLEQFLTPVFVLTFEMFANNEYNINYIIVVNNYFLVSYKNHQLRLKVYQLFGYEPVIIYGDADIEKLTIPKFDRFILVDLRDMLDRASENEHANTLILEKKLYD